MTFHTPAHTSVDPAYLEPGEFIDSDHPLVVAYAHKHTVKHDSEKGRAVALYYAIRDGFRYNPYMLDLRRESLKASDLLSRDSGYCVEKACLMAACCRAIGIPSRLGFGIVKNHIGVETILKYLKTDLLVFHGYAEIWLEGRWVKATPAFNAALCDLYNVEPLPFDGVNDSLFQQYTQSGDCFMEYVHDYGQFADIPRTLFINELKKYYPHIFEDEAQAKYKFKVVLDT